MATVPVVRLYDAPGITIDTSDPRTRGILARIQAINTTVQKYPAGSILNAIEYKQLTGYSTIVSNYDAGHELALSLIETKVAAYVAAHPI